MAKASANLFPYLHLVPAAAPAAPAAGSQRLYLDSADSNKLKRKDSSGAVTTIEGGGGGGGGGTGFTKVRKSPSQTIPASTWTAVTWNLEDIDTLAAHDNATNNSRITVPTTGVYTIDFYLTMSSSSGDVLVQLGVNGTRIPGRNQLPGGTNKSFGITRTLSLTAGDYVEGWVYSGANVVTTTFSDDECLMSAFRAGTI